MAVTGVLAGGSCMGWRQLLCRSTTVCGRAKPSLYDLELLIMAASQAELVKSLVDAGVHFGHRVSRWNPKMQPYIKGKRNMIHIMDVKETIKGLIRAKKLVQQLVAQGKDVLFVGTK